MNPFETASKPLPAFISREDIIANLRLYRSAPEQIAAMLEALSESMQAEHYRAEGKLSDALHDEGENVADAATNLRAVLDMPAPDADAIAAEASDALHDRRVDNDILKAA